jgi:hypothetical protein
MGYVDCDSHVIETDATWEYLDPTERVYRPRVHPRAEAALCRSYNRWAAERVAGRDHRFPWAMRAPLRMRDRAIEELEFTAAHGGRGRAAQGD